jgi:hypothetical protein
MCFLWGTNWMSKYNLYKLQASHSYTSSPSTEPTSLQSVLPSSPECATFGQGHWDENHTMCVWVSQTITMCHHPKIQLQQPLPYFLPHFSSHTHHRPGLKPLPPPRQSVSLRQLHMHLVTGFQVSLYYRDLMLSLLSGCISASYSEGLRFTPSSTDWLSSLKFFMVSLSPYRQMIIQHLKFGHNLSFHIISKSLFINHPSIWMCIIRAKYIAGDVPTHSYPSFQTPQFTANSFNISWRECRSYRCRCCKENTLELRTWQILLSNDIRLFSN